MKNIIFSILASMLLISCTSYNDSKNLNAQTAQLAHSKFNNINNDFSYQEYKSLILSMVKIINFQISSSNYEEN